MKKGTFLKGVFRALRNSWSSKTVYRKYSWIYINGERVYASDNKNPLCEETQKKFDVGFEHFNKGFREMEKGFNSIEDAF